MNTLEMMPFFFWNGTSNLLWLWLQVVYSGAILEVCMRKLVFYPEVVGFIEEEKDKFPCVKIQYAYNSPLKLIMLDDHGEHMETIRSSSCLLFPSFLCVMCVSQPISYFYVVFIKVHWAWEVLPIRILVLWYIFWNRALSYEFLFHAWETYLYWAHW